MLLIRSLRNILLGFLFRALQAIDHYRPSGTAFVKPQHRESIAPTYSVSTSKHEIHTHRNLSIVPGIFPEVLRDAMGETAVGLLALLCREFIMK